MTGPLPREAKRALANAHRAAIRQGHIRCEPECRHGMPDIWHSPRCYWIQAVEAIYSIERELEGIAPTGNKTL